MLDTLHAVSLRFTSALWARLLRLAQLIDRWYAEQKWAAINVFETIKQLLLNVGIRLSNACGAWHIRQCHGAQVDGVCERLNIDAVAKAFPHPYAGAVGFLLNVWPFYIQAHVHVLYPARTYDADCATLSAEVRETAIQIRTVMSSIFPSVPKKADTPGAGFYGPFTPPSNFGAVVWAPELFERECSAAGIAAITAAVMELSHVMPRVLLLGATMHGGYHAGRHLHKELMENLFRQKFGRLQTFGNNRLFKCALHARMRHRTAERKYRAFRATACTPFLKP